MSYDLLQHTKTDDGNADDVMQLLIASGHRKGEFLAPSVGVLMCLLLHMKGMWAAI